MIVVKWISKLVLKIVMKEGCKLGLNCSLGSSKKPKKKNELPITEQAIKQILNNLGFTIITLQNYFIELLISF
ncbi:Uncharacterised protein [Streptococcus pneumoniae]|nr:Uncharacterised protein [Streptococcus pneumoniae]